MRGNSQPLAAGSPTEETSETYVRLNLIGESPKFLAAVELIKRMARCDATVLIQGETGTGKELAGRAIHYLGARRDAPFVAVNCGAIPDTLIESELFGHVRGAFTDARSSRSGLIAQAAGGTLFLDEVDSLIPKSQVALLRFLQDREYRPVGSELVQRADVRIIAATNADLAALAEEGRYRLDLLFRLNVLSLQLPPLRDRDDDVMLLADVFLRRLCEQYRSPARHLDPDLRDSLRNRPWPGNVRELENFIQREFLLSDGPVIGTATQTAPEPVGDGGPPTLSFREAKARAIEDFERRYLSRLLSHARGNISLASRISGKERRRLGKMLKKHGLVRTEFRYDQVPSE